MTEKQIKQVKAQLPEGETFHSAYRAFEGDIRVISVDRQKNQHRYAVIFDGEFNATIKAM